MQTTITSIVFAIFLLFSASLKGQWSVSSLINNSVSIEVGNQEYPSIVSDGTGGAIVTWWDMRNSTFNSDIYAQRISATGNVLWTTNGVVVCSEINNQSNPKIVSDGLGGAIITWYDFRNGSNNDIYIQYVNSAGVVQWAINGLPIAVMNGQQISPDIVTDGLGGAYLAWKDTRSGSLEIYVQHINSSGVIQYTANGIPVVNVPGNKGSCGIIPDGSGGIITTWVDNRNGNADIYAQHINSLGTLLWTTAGIPVCTDVNGQQYPSIISDGSGGAIITWEDDRNGNIDIYSQKLDASGVAQYTVNGLSICSATNTQERAVLASDGLGGAIISWLDYRNSPAYNVYAQRLLSSGGVSWASNGISICNLAAFGTTPVMVSDGSGGAIISWNDTRVSTYDNIYAQKINALGVSQWTVNGVKISTKSEYQFNQVITVDGSGGAIISWHDGNNAITYDIYAQNVCTDGFLGLSTAQTCNGIAALPIELLYFTANNDETNSQINLAWCSATETNNDFYTIERSADGYNFTPLKSVKGSKNSVNTICYDAIDSHPLEGLSYYRLKQTDEDGSTEISNSVSVERKTNKKVIITKNESNGNYLVDCKVNEQLQTPLMLEIYNSFGQVILKEETINFSEHYFREFDLKTYGNGIYLIVIVINDEQFVSRVFVN